MTGRSKKIEVVHDWKVKVVGKVRAEPVMPPRLPVIPVKKVRKSKP